MKKTAKKTALVMVLLCTGLFMVLVTPPGAVAAWYTCTIDEVGPGASWTIVWLTDTGGTFTNRSFVFNQTNANKMLATALTALTNGNTIEADLGTGAQGTIISAFYIKK